MSQGIVLICRNTNYIYLLLSHLRPYLLSNVGGGQLEVETAPCQESGFKDEADKTVIISVIAQKRMPHNDSFHHTPG